MDDIYFDTCMVIFHRDELVISSTGTIISHQNSKEKQCYVLCNAANLLQSKTVTTSEEFLSFNNHDNAIISKFKIYIQLTSITGGKKIVSEFVLIWNCKILEGKIKKIFGEDWKIGEDEESGKEMKTYLSWFCLLKFNYPENKICSNMAETKHHKISPGLPVICKSSPFDENSSRIFGSCFSRGIVCAVDNKLHPNIFIVDARCLPGSEGGVIIQASEEISTNNFVPISDVLGFILAPMCWKNNELVGLTICASVNTTISSLLQVVASLKSKGGCKMFDEIENLCRRITGLSAITGIKQDSNLFMKNDVVVPFIECGSSWGSAVLVATCNRTVYIVTCRHVVKEHRRQNRVYMRIFNYWYETRLIFEANLNTELDFALLACEMDLYLVMELKKIGIHDNWIVNFAEEASYEEGLEVFSKGHGLFGSSSDIEMIVSEGVVSKVCHALNYDDSPDTPILLQVTSQVHKGASGGALVHRKGGKFFGLLVNNIRDETLNICMTDVAFCIPASLFMRNIEKYVYSMDRNELTSLNVVDDDFNQLWRLCNTSNNLSSKL